MPASNILRATTDPDLLTRLRDVLDSSARADIAVGYFFMSAFEAEADSLARLGKVRILVGRADRPALESVALGLQQSEVLRAQLEADGMVQRRQRDAIAREVVEGIATGVPLLPQTGESQNAVSMLYDLVASGLVEVRTYRRRPLHTKAYLCWYDSHVEPGAAVVGSSNLTLAGFSGNTELNVRVTGDTEMEALRDWFDALWEDSEDISQMLTVELERSWAIAQTLPYHVFLKALYELYHTDVHAPELVPQRTEELANFQLDATPRPGDDRRLRRLLRRRRRRSGQDLRRCGVAQPAAVQLPKRRPAPDPLPCRSQAHVGGVQRTLRPGRRGAIP